MSVKEGEDKPLKYPTIFNSADLAVITKLDLAEAELKRQEAGLAKLKKEVPLQIDVARETLAVAQTDEARAKDNLKLTTDEVQKTIDESNAAVELAKANFTLARQETDRWTELAAQNATTKRKAQEVTRAHDAAKAELRLADARLPLARFDARRGIRPQRRLPDTARRICGVGGRLNPTGTR